MKVISLIGQEEQVLVDAAERMAEEFKRKEIKLGVFLQKNEAHKENTPYHGCVTRYDNKTFFEVGEAFELDSLMSVCCCDMLLMINLELPNIPKVLHGPIEETYKITDDVLCILGEEKDHYKTTTTPVFNYKEEVSSVVSYIWRNGVEMISNKNIQLTEEFIKYADTARKNVAVVKIKSQYGYEMNCIKKTFRSEESAHQEAFFAGILNSTVKIYPQVIDVIKTVIYREFAEGDKLNKVIQHYTSEEGERSFYYLESIILSVIDTINFIHNELADHFNQEYSIGNMSFEHFLVTDDTVLYLELNGIHPGHSVMDFEYFCAYILQSDVIRTSDKRSLINSIIGYINRSFFYDKELTWNSIEVAFQEIENG